MPDRLLTCIDVCAGAGGQANGLESAGFRPVALVENDIHAASTLRANRPAWNVLEMDLLDLDPADHPYLYDVDLLAAGPPRVKSAASVKRPEDHEARELLKATVWLAAGVRPQVVLVENVPDLATSDKFEDLRDFVHIELEHLGYRLDWRVLNANAFGVPQDRRHGVLVACRGDVAERFHWPAGAEVPAQTVGEVLGESMKARGWPYAEAWAAQADRQAPALVGGSKNRGGADLGPTGSKKAWARMGVNGGTIADEVPDRDFPWVPGGDPKQLPALTVPQVATLQGFPSDWRLSGGKTARYRQLGHAWPPPVAAAMGREIAAALDAG